MTGHQEACMERDWLEIMIPLLQLTSIQKCSHSVPAPCKAQECLGTLMLCVPTQVAQELDQITPVVNWFLRNPITIGYHSPCPLTIQGNVATRKSVSLLNYR